MYSYKDLIEKDKKYIWHPFTQMKSWLNEDPLIIEHGDKNMLYDMEGRGYIDAYASLWCNVHGHNIEYINNAIKEQVDSISHSTTLGASNIPSILLAEKLIEISPEGLTKVFYSDSGATSVEIALKMAYQYWMHKEGKPREYFIKFDNAYHGDTIGSVSLGGVDLFHSIFKGLLFNTIKVKSTYSYRMEGFPTLEEAGDIVLNEIEEKLKENAGKVIAIVLEPKMFGAAGMVRQPDGFVSKVSKLSKKYDTLLICDEVATGFGRTSSMFACESEGVSPDFMCVAKGLTGGYLPVAATLTSDKIFDAFLGEPHEAKTFYHGHTFTGNQLGCAAAIASLELFDKNNLISHVKEITPHLMEKLNRLFGCHENIGEIRQSGVMTGIEIVENPKTRKSFAPNKLIGQKIILECRKHGVLTRNLDDVIIVNPPLSITKDEIDTIINAISAAVKEVVEK
jgi:adenosylmethionine-8-amino-7-oxononanoate aminotransferase